MFYTCCGGQGEPDWFMRAGPLEWNATQASGDTDLENSLWVCTYFFIEIGVIAGKQS